MKEVKVFIDYVEGSGKSAFCIRMCVLTDEFKRTKQKLN